MDLLRGFNISKGGRYICLCDLEFETEDDAIEHMSVLPDGFCANGLRKNSDDDYECICGSRYKHRYDIFQLHHVPKSTSCVTKHNIKKEAWCEDCKKEFPSVANYLRHCETNKHQEKVSPNKLPITCDVCNVRCPSQEQMKAHLATKKHKRMLEEPNLSLECEPCGFKCKSFVHMKKHLSTKKHLKKTDLSLSSSSNTN